MAMTNSERQKTFYRRKREETLQGKQRAFFLLPDDVVTRIKTLAGFYELEQEQVVEKAIAMLWEDRYALHPVCPNIRPVKVADDLPEPDLSDPPGEQEPEKVLPGEIQSAIEIEQTAAEIKKIRKKSAPWGTGRNTPPALIDIIPDQKDTIKTTN